MSSTRRGVSVDLLRRGLLVALVAFVASVIGLYVVGRMGRPSQTRVAPEPDETRQGELILSGKGFDYGLTQGDREVFHIRATRILSDREDNYELEGVELQMEREDGSVYQLESDSALYDLDSQEATFSGNVRFLGPNQVELTADGLELREGGAILVSSSPVQFLFLDRFRGRADRLRINPKKNIFVLAGRVAVDTLPGDARPMSLRCRRFSFERDNHLLRAEGEVILHRGEDTLRSRRLSVTLAEDESRVEFILARWDVRGELVQLDETGQTSRVRLRGRELSVAFEPGTEDPQSAELTASQKQPAVLSVSDESGLARFIRGEYLVGQFQSGALSEARAFDNVEIREFLSFDPETVFRTACADSAVATLSASGELKEVHLDGTVLLQQEDVAAFGDEAHADLVAQQMELIGEPAKLLRTGEQLEAPRIVYDQAAEEIVAEKDVRAVLTSSRDLDLSTDPRSGQQPIRIQAERADWGGTPPAVVFRGQVRAWQGENFLVTDELTGEPETSRVSAKGRVKTVWRPEPAQTTSEGGLPPEPLEVTADEMVYERSERLLSYSGNARAIQLKRTLRCEEIFLFLGEEGGFERMVCEGNTHLLDGDSGNTVMGDTATYRPGDRTVRVEGSPVVLRDSQGTEIQGKVLIYDFETATARIQSEPPPPASADPDP